MGNRDSVEDHSALVSGQVVHSKQRGRTGILLPVAVLISTLVTLCCLIFQLKMFLLYLDLKQQSRCNSQIISHYMENQERSDVLYLINSECQTVSPYSSGNVSDGEQALQRRKRSDEADADQDGRNSNRRRGGSNRNDEVSRSRGSSRTRQDANPGVKVIHLELHKGHRTQLRVNQGEYITTWRASAEFQNQDFASYSDRSVNIYKTGVYLIYTQITFEDRYGRWSYSIMVNDQPFIKCLSTEWGIEKDPQGVPVTTYGQCHTSAVTHLNSRDTVRIKSMYRTDNIHTDSDLTFWGFVKLS